MINLLPKSTARWIEILRHLIPSTSSWLNIPINKPCSFAGSISGRGTGATQHRRVGPGGYVRSKGITRPGVPNLALPPPGSQQKSWGKKTVGGGFFVRWHKVTVGRNWSHPAKRESMERWDMSMTTVRRASSRRFMTLGPGCRVHTADTRGRQAGK